MLNIDGSKSVDYDYAAEYVNLDDSELIPSTNTDQQPTYVQMAAYSFSGFTKQVFVYSTKKLCGCFAAVVLAPTAYPMAANYFAPAALPSNILVRTTSSAVISSSFELGSAVGEKMAEVTWGLSSAAISRTITFIYDRGVSRRDEWRQHKKASKISIKNSFAQE